MLQILPPLTYAAAAIIILMVALGRGASPALRWGLPAATGALLVVFSLWTLAEEGLIQFWINHTTTLAGVQVWFDLVIGLHRGLQAFLEVDLAQALGHRPRRAVAEHRAVDGDDRHHEHRGRGDEGLVRLLRLVDGEGAFLHLHLRLAGEAQDGGAGDAVQDLGPELAGDDACRP
jgi:hypothetical protein